MVKKPSYEELEKRIKELEHIEGQLNIKLERYALALSGTDDEICARDNDGKAYRMAGAYKDITNQKQLEAAAQKESDFKYENLVSNIPGTAYQFSLSPDGVFHFEFIGDNCISLFGYSAKEILEDYSLVFDSIPQPDADMVQKAIKQSAASLSRYNIEHRFIKKNGETIWIHAVSAPRRRPNGEIIWDGIGLDISEKKLIEKTLRQSEKKLKERESILSRIHQFAPLEMGILDANRTFHCPNQQLAEITGYSTEELEDMPSRNLYESEEEYLRVAEEKKII